MPVASARELAFAALTESFSFVQPLLDADRAAVAGREVYDDGYFTLFFQKARPIIEQRLATSIRDVVSVITAAWVEAGRPAIPCPSRVRLCCLARHCWDWRFGDGSFWPAKVLTVQILLMPLGFVA